MHKKIYLSDLKDIKVVYKGDIYEVARLLYKIYNNRDASQGGKITGFCTRALAEKFSSLADIDIDKIYQIFIHNNIALGVRIEPEKVEQNKVVRVDFKSAHNKKQTSEDPDEKWSRIPDHFKEKVLNNVWCGGCRDVTTIKDFEKNMIGDTLVLNGFCSVCNKPVARVLEE